MTKQGAERYLRSSALQYSACTHTRKPLEEACEVICRHGLFHAAIEYARACGYDIPECGAHIGVQDGIAIVCSLPAGHNSTHLSRLR